MLYIPRTQDIRKEVRVGHYVLTLPLALVCLVLFPIGPISRSTAAEPANRTSVQSIGFEVNGSVPSSNTPRKVLLRGSDARFQSLLTGLDSNGYKLDLTREAKFEITPPEVASVDSNGVLVPLRNGTATIRAIAPGGASTSLDLEVLDWADNPPVSFPNQVVPIFTKLGCNGGGCHGKAAGQNGFKLSLLGFEPNEDYEHLVKESRGRRLSQAAPDSSLLLTKAINVSPHGGGQRLEVDSHEYRILRRWIEQGMAPGTAADPQVVRIRIVPDQRRMQPSTEQQLGVIATYSDGTESDVTAAVQFESNDTEMADVSKRGLVSIKSLAGEVAVMARYQGQVAVFQASVPVLDGKYEWPEPTNPIDAAVIAQLQSLNIPMSKVCDDATFLRRVTLDLTGRLPTLDETREFGKDLSAGKRGDLIDRLLASDQYAEHFANKWMLILRNRRDTPGHKAGSFAFHRWLREQISSNRPFDEFVRDIVAASGSIDVHPPVVWYRQVGDTFSRLEDTAQLFLGQRIQCARCHHHPFEKWSQKDYYQLASFFSQVKTKPGQSPDETIVYASLGAPRASHPKTGESLKPAGLDGPIVEDSDRRDPREVLVDWMVEKQNPFFARSIANRYWKHFLGRGLVEPEDDMRATNPPSNKVLLDTLANQLTASKYDLKQLIRSICNSRTYQLDSEPNGENLKDRKCYSRFYPKRMSAEQILDSIDQLTGTKTAFDLMPEGTRAVALPDSAFRSYFLTVFGRPDATTACECERANESTLAQSLHFANSKELLEKLGAPNAIPQEFVKNAKSVDDAVREIYARALSREPNENEVRASLEYVQKKENKQEAYQDLVWAILNCKEFLFNH
ncbi:MAG: DUF1549 and DUF1553 domain-containing protein [Pirellula sp.]